MIEKVLGKKHFEFECLNISRHLKRLAEKGVCTFNLKKLNYKTISFSAYVADEKKIKNEFKNAHMLSEKNLSGLVFAFSVFKKNIAVILSFLICFASFPFFNAFVWQVKVFAVDESLSLKINECLQAEKVKAGQFKAKYDVDRIKNLLLQRFENVAFVDVEIKNETLLINVREKFYSETENLASQPVIAQFDGIVESVNIQSGTAKVKAGDVVRAGDILVEAYIKRGGSFIPCEVNGEVAVRSFKTFEVDFFEKTTSFVRTGKKVNKNYFTFFKDFDKMKLGKCGFQNFDVQVVCLNEKAFPILPIKLTSVCFYELEEKEFFQDFEQNKNEILQKIKGEKQNEISATKIFDEEISSEKIGDGEYKITYYVDFLKTY